MANWTEFLKSRKSIIFIVICTAIVYINSLSNGFVWDDNVLLVPNEAYKKLDFGRIFFTKVNFLEYLPFRDLSYVIDYQIWGMNPFGFHLTNLLLYLISLIVLFNMVKNIAILSGEKEWEFIAFWATLIFALHPLHAEAVNFIHGRNTLLAALFLFLSFNLCLEGIQKQKNILVLLSAVIFVMAVFSKAIVIFFPLFLALILFLVPATIASWRKKALVLLVFLGIDIFAMWIHIVNASATSMMNINTIRFGIDSKMMLMAKAVQIPFFYLKMFIVPYPLNVLYPVTFVSGGVILRAAAAGIALIAVLFIVWFQRKKQPLVFLAVAWYFLSLLPVLNIFPTVPVVADRYAYLAVFGVGLILAIVLRRAYQKKKILLFIGLVIIAAWSYIDFNRNMDWSSDLTLFEREISVNPDVDRIYIVEALWVAGRYEEALSYMKEEKGKTETFRDQYQGRYLFKLGRYSDAIAHYKEALVRGGSALKEVHLDIAMAYEKEGMDMQALEEYLKTIETDSLDVLEKYNRQAREGAGRVRGRLMQGLEEARNQALNDPLNFQYQANLALSLHRLGLYEEAEKFYDRALKLNQSSWEAWYNLGLARMKQRRHAEAIQSFEKSLLINPGNKDAFNNAGICYMSLHNYSQAVKYYERALALDPNFFYASFNLGRVYFNAGNREMSHKYFSLAKTLAGENSGAQAMVDQYLRYIR
ncbi:MAG: tetratricopeptide repeat protein [Thermodesulfovibrionales bacterium]|nr:tetratricopeptide repeat protein [Thermodesulfovibrionales bacterium]